jgi:hypothetical protein
VCCGQQRNSLKTNVATRKTSTGPQLKLAYLKSAPVEVRGPVTGRAYYFSEHRREQLVDARDATGLLRTHFFRQSR